MFFKLRESLLVLATIYSILSTRPLSAKLCDGLVDSIAEQRLKDFESSLPQKLILNKWKRWVLTTLFKSDVKKGREYVKVFAVFKDGYVPLKADEVLGSFGSFVVYPLIVGTEAIRSYQSIFRDKNISAAEKIYLPFKALIGIGVKHFFATVLVVASLTGVTDEAINATGFVLADPLLNETDPSDLKDDEVIVIVKLVFTEDDRVGQNEHEYTENLAATYPEQIRVLDFSFYNPDLETLSHRGIAKKFQAGLINKKIRKLIVTGHGSPGMVYNDSIPINLESFTNLLRPLVPSFADNAEIHLAGCDVAATDTCKAKVKDLADELLIKGGTVYANNTISFSRTGLPRKILDGFCKVSPASDFCAGALFRSKAAIDSGRDYQSGPLFGEPFVFKYTVKPSGR